MKADLKALLTPDELGTLFGALEHYEEFWLKSSDETAEDRAHYDHQAEKARALRNRLFSDTKLEAK